MRKTIAISKDEKTILVVLPSKVEDKRCFCGRDLKTGEISCYWMRDNFEFFEQKRAIKLA